MVSETESVSREETILESPWLLFVPFEITTFLIWKNFDKSLDKKNQA
jgi:hypothetical protein